MFLFFDANINPPPALFPIFKKKSVGSVLKQPLPLLLYLFRFILLYFFLSLFPSFTKGFSPSLLEQKKHFFI